MSGEQTALCGGLHQSSLSSRFYLTNQALAAEHYHTRHRLRRPTSSNLHQTEPWAVVLRCFYQTVVIELVTEDYPTRLTCVNL